MVECPNFAVLGWVFDYQMLTAYWGFHQIRESGIELVAI